MSRGAPSPTQGHEGRVQPRPLKKAFAAAIERSRPAFEEIAGRPRDLADGLTRDPLSRCARCGARHIEHDLGPAGFTCPDREGVFVPPGAVLSPDEQSPSPIRER